MEKKYTETGRKKQKQKTRTKILAGAKKFLTRGVDFTLEDIARETSLSRATVYRYYSNVEVLSREAGLDLHTKSPQSILEPLAQEDLTEVLLGIQDYYNRLAIDNETAFRKYLSLVVTGTSNTDKRGARRSETLALALENSDLKLSKATLNKFKVVATVLMGIEALVVTKDVCQLDDREARKVLSWGLEKVIKGMLAG